MQLRFGFVYRYIIICVFIDKGIDEERAMQMSFKNVHVLEEMFIQDNDVDEEEGNDDEEDKTETEYETETD